MEKVQHFIRSAFIVDRLKRRTFNLEEEKKRTFFFSTQSHQPANQPPRPPKRHGKPTTMVTTAQYPHPTSTITIGSVSFLPRDPKTTSGIRYDCWRPNAKGKPFERDIITITVNVPLRSVSPLWLQWLQWSK